MQVASSGSSGEQSVTVFESVRTTFIAVSMSQYGERTGRTLNHYRDGDRSFPGARQWFDLISTVFP
jgi:hypothetical protein